MRLKRFRAKAVHGYINFDVPFNASLTFLTGINGSGKTTVLNAIMALVTPDLETLAKIDYQKMSVTFTKGRSNFIIESVKNSNEIILSLNQQSKTFVYRTYVPDEGLPTYRIAEHERDYYKEILSESADHPVIEGILNHTTPIFLGLDRRSKLAPDRPPRSPYMRRRALRRQNNIFPSSLSAGLAQAEALVVESRQDALISTGEMAEGLQKNLLLKLLAMRPEQAKNYFQSRPLAKDNKKELGKLRNDIDSLADILDVPKEEIQGAVGPFLDFAEDARDSLTKLLNKRGAKKHPHDNKLLTLMSKYRFSEQHLQRIRIVSEVVSQYNKERTLALEKFEQYAELVNKFINDSGKKLFFSRRDMLIGVENSQPDQDISCLSSGEAQIFIILTHLAFNSQEEGGKLFIIDEPELSLHIEWQELFVNSIQSANPDVQYVLATHSPSIILNRSDECIDVNEHRKFSKKKGK